VPKVRDSPSANIPKEIDQAIQEFLQSREARKLGIKSRDEFVRRACISVLTKYNDEYKALSRLFDSQI